MGFLDKAAAKAKEELTKAVDSHGDKIAAGIDKAGDLLDQKTGGKHTDKIQAGKAKASGALDALDGKHDDDMPTATAEPAPEAHPADPTAPPDMPDPEEPTTDPQVDPSDRTTYPE